MPDEQMNEFDKVVQILGHFKGGILGVLTITHVCIGLQVAVI